MDQEKTRPISIVAEVKENEKGELTIQLPSDFIAKTELKDGEAVPVKAQALPNPEARPR